MVVYTAVDYHLTSTNYIVVVTASNKLIYLPPATGMPIDSTFKIKNLSAVGTMIIPNGVENIDDLPNLTLYAPYDFIWLFTDGVSRWLIESYGSPREIIKTVSGDYQMLPRDFTVLQSTAAATTTLPDARGIQGLNYRIKNVGDSNVSTFIATLFGQTIDGNAGVYHNIGHWTVVSLISDGTNWITC